MTTAERWLVRYRERPFVAFRQHVMLVEAATMADALATAYHRMIEQGLDPDVSEHTLERAGLDCQTIAAARALGVPTLDELGMVPIVQVKPYRVTVSGTVLAEKEEASTA